MVAQGAEGEGGGGGGGGGGGHMVEFTHSTSEEEMEKRMFKRYWVVKLNLYL